MLPLRDCGRKEFVDQYTDQRRIVPGTATFRASKSPRTEDWLFMASILTFDVVHTISKIAVDLDW